MIPTTLAALVLAAPIPSPIALPKPADTQDVVYLGTNGPVRISFRVRLGDKLASKSWEEYLDRFFRFHDRGNDGTLDASEVGRLTRLPMIANQLLFNGRRGGTQVTMAEVDTDKNGKATLAEVKSYYRRIGFAPLTAYAQPANPVAQQMTDALYKHLDRNRDNKLSREELADAPGVLAKLDADEDELLNAQELLQQPQANGQFQVAEQPLRNYQPRGPTATSFVVVVPGESPANLAKRLAAVVTPKRTEAELTAWAKKPADLVLDIDLNGKVARSGPLMSASTVEGDTLVRLALPGARMEIARGPRGPEAARDGTIAFYTQQFQAAIADKEKKGLTKQQLTENPNLQFFNNLFDDADRDADGTLMLIEMQAYTNLFAESMGNQVQIAVTDSGRGMYDLLDRDGSGSLGLRELRGGTALLAEFAATTGQLAVADLPRQFRASVGRGFSDGNARPVPVRMGATVYPTGPGKGPTWFRKMDRNKDGDVSPREFLGTPDDFRMLDRDGDGLMSVEEAEKVGAK